MLIDLNNGKLPKAMLVGVPTPEVNDYENQESLEELKRLVTTLGFTVVATTYQRRQNVSGAVPLGEGKLKEIAKVTGGTGIVKTGPVIKKTKAKLKEEENNKREEELEVDDYSLDDEEDEEEVFDPSKKPDAIIFDCELTPSQIANLKSAFSVEVIDRTGVIVEIFSKHAKTREARLQVEIARLKYLAPRIRESGSSERQGSGAGARGAGETDIELDKRRIRDRIAELKREISSIQKEQGTRRKKRSDQPCVALVGYTNAGKSSLMRRLTGSDVLVADKLFATLDTTVRMLHPETHPKILVSDTVGFIRKLPHDLVVSFRSTLDEALNSSLLLYVIDSSDKSWRTHLEVTKTTLSGIGVTEEMSSIYIFNKIDLLSQKELHELRHEFPDSLFISTRNDKDIKMIHEFIREFFEKEMSDDKLFISYQTQGAIGDIRENLRVIEEKYENDGIYITVRGKKEIIKKLKERYQL
ncbi:GTPase HflX [Silvanigrella paludirubra]|uniref:GTPase HflX n=1 Tax=Silvanigrella paludirubra TaxID=2499159 RepID=A0A6N6VP85_9BACT|nr:GTPase HflX [Silvanigrella paludirubra]KAB8037003.1 GTPase HflX [Silvanigrella paludirubra]